MFCFGADSDDGHLASFGATMNTNLNATHILRTFSGFVEVPYVEMN